MMVLRGVHMLDGVWTVGTGASTNRPAGREASGVTEATTHRKEEEEEVLDTDFLETPEGLVLRRTHCKSCWTGSLVPEVKVHLCKVSCRAASARSSNC